MRRLLLIFALLAAPCQAAIPTFVANGAATVTAGTGTCTPTMPGSIVANDILILVACGEGNDVGGTLALTTANGFAAFTGLAAQSGDDNDGTTEENPECDCMVWWKRAVGSDSAPVVTDSGDHTTCAVHQFRGVKTSGDPHNIGAAGNDSNANDTSGVIPGATTTHIDSLVVLVQGTSNNATGTANCGAVTNADLASITERFDSSNTTGLGGGHCIITGTKATTGAYANSTLTMGATTYKGAFSIALQPPDPPACTAGLNLPLLGVGGCP